MIDHAHELRRKLGSDDLIDHVDIHANVKPLLAELLDRLEAAEKEVAHIKEVEFPRKARAVAAGWETKCVRLEQERVIDEQRIADLMAELNRVGHENEELRAKIEAMEKQEPAMWANSSNIISAKINKERRSAGDQHTCSETKTAYHDVPLYLAPGAKGESE